MTHPRDKTLIALMGDGIFKIGELIFKSKRCCFDCFSRTLCS